VGTIVQLLDDESCWWSSVTIRAAPTRSRPARAPTSWSCITSRKQP